MNFEVTLKKNSWHYKLLNFLYEKGVLFDSPETYTNLCPYFWMVVASIMLLIFAIILSPAIIFIFLIIKLFETKLVDTLIEKSTNDRISKNIRSEWIFYFIVDTWKNRNNYGIWRNIIAIGTHILFLGIFIPALLSSYIYSIILFPTIMLTITSVLVLTIYLIWKFLISINNEDSLLNQYLLAIKRKICPHLNWKD